MALKSADRFTTATSLKLLATYIYPCWSAGWVEDQRSFHFYHLKESPLVG